MEPDHPADTQPYVVTGTMLCQQIHDPEHEL
jgi:hypothetical protein